MISLELPRLGAATGVLAAYAALCIQAWRVHRRRVAPLNEDNHAGVLIAYASQSGFAQELAGEAARALQAAGLPVHPCALDQIGAAQLRDCTRALFLISTSGEGDAPDNGAGFVRQVMTTRLDLQGLRYGLLALGDRRYANFCAFGRALDHWLQQQGAGPIFPRIEADGAANDALITWRHQLASFAGLAEVAEAPQAATGFWRIRACRQLNPGSAGAPACHVELEPVSEDSPAATITPLPHWAPGDLLQLIATGDDARPRDYSIASLPEDGAVHLIVRRVTGADGTPGALSSLLTQEAAVGTRLRGRVRPHPNFRIGDNADRPLLLIGNGTGLAGLLAHLRARARRGDGRNWLLFGERNKAHDDLHGAEIDALEHDNLLTRCDRVWSRDPPHGEYVQDRLRRAADTVRTWVEGGAAIYVCGNAVGMGPAVHAALADILGNSTLDALTRAGRYRRDIY